MARRTVSASGGCVWWEQIGPMQQGDGDATRRLDGWKAIAGYFNRDRSTVMRWARERHLPVRRLPGGKQGSVFAFERDLAAWALNHADAAPAPPAPPASPAPGMARRPWLPILLVLGVVAGGTAATIAFRDAGGPARRSPALTLPQDPGAAADFVAARDRWARRTEPDLAAAIALLRRVIARAPDFAPAHAALADAWLLEREYGQVDGTAAFAAAERAARRAVALDPDLPGAHRALGFIAYWRDNRKEAGMAAFRRAVQLDESDGQTRFWYANVLADSGQDHAAQLEYARARLLLPGSTAIDVEQAYSHWLGGRDRQALAELRALVARNPTDPNLHLCLSWVYISLGDLGSFVRENALVARYRNEPRLLHRAGELSAAYARDPRAAFALLMRQRREDVAGEQGTTRQAPAMFASAMGDRAETLALLQEAVAADEHWYGLSIRTRIAARWPGDAAIQPLLARVYTPAG